MLEIINYNTDPILQLRNATYPFALTNISNVATLRTTEPSYSGQAIFLLGNTTAGIGSGNFWYDATDTTTPDNNETVIVTTGGKRWKLIITGVVTSTGSTEALTLADRFADVGNAKDYGMVTVNEVDNSPFLEAAIANLPNGGKITIPNGKYDFLTDVEIASDIIIEGQGYSTRLNKIAAASNHFLLRASSTGTLNNVGIKNMRLTNERVTASGTQAIINIDGPDVLNFDIRELFFSNTVGYCDSIFFKAPAGKTIKNVTVADTKFTDSPRMHLEFINHDNTTNFNITGLKILNNDFGDCDFIQCSISGAIYDVNVLGNSYRGNGGSIGLELVGPQACIAGYNVFEGTFTSLISSSGGTFSNGDISLIGNKTQGQVGGRIFLSNFGSSPITGNDFDITGKFILSGTDTDGCNVGQNHIKTDASNVIECDNSPNHNINNNFLSNSTVGSNFSAVRAINASATDIILKDNEINKGTGGEYFDEVSGGTFKVTSGNILDGDAQDAPIDSKVFIDSKTITTSGTTSTLTITFAPSSSWRPNTINVSAASCRTDSNEEGAASSSFVVKSNKSGGTGQVTTNVNYTSANLSLAATYGTNTMTITATVSGTSVQVTWGIIMFNRNAGATVVYA